MYASAYPGLSPIDLGRRPAARRSFPMDAPRQLRFYRARNALYHAVRSIGLAPGDAVAMPDYHHGTEVAAVRAAGARVLFYRIDRRLDADLDSIRAVLRERPKAVVLIHYFGWPQPTAAIAAQAREAGAVVVEDCALSLLSEPDGTPLGSTGEYAAFCLYKTLPVPNGAILVARDANTPLASSAARPCGWATSAARTSERLIDWVRVRADGAGRRLASLKAASGRGLDRAGVRRWPVGDGGFDLRGVDVRMSRITEWLLRRIDYPAVRRRRRENFLRLRELLDGCVSFARDDLPEGACPLFVPVFAPDKSAAARELARGGVDAVEFWNEGDPDCRPGPDAAFLRRHVLEIPCHQDLGEEHVEFVAEQVLRLGIGRMVGMHA